MDPLSIIVLFGLVAFGGICGAALVSTLQVRPLQEEQRLERERLRNTEKAFAVHERVYRIHYQILTRRIEELTQRKAFAGSETPTVRPPAT